MTDTRNLMNIPVLPEGIRSQLFHTPFREDEVSAYLASQDMGDYADNLPNNKPYPVPDELDLPVKAEPGVPVFQKITEMAEKRVEFVKVAMQGLIDSGRAPVIRPSTLVIQPGWTRYEPIKRGTAFEITASAPQEFLLVFDIETMVKWGQMLLMAAGWSGKAWYIWIHPCLCGGQIDYNAKLDMGKAKLLIAHNAGFDRQGVDPACDHPSNKWWEDCLYIDTMSLHMVVSGLASEQRTSWLMQQNKSYSEWVKMGSPKSLVESWNHHVGKPRNLELMGEEDKAIRNIFVESTKVDHIVARLRELLVYCLSDVRATVELAQSLWPKYLSHAPSPISLAGMLIRGSQVLPLADDWFQWAAKTEDLYNKVDAEISDNLKAIAVDLKDRFMGGESFDDCPWMGQLDWSPAKTGKNKGLPAWYRTKKVEAEGVSGTGILAPLLLKVKFDGKTVFYNSKHKWGVLGHHGFGRNEVIDGNEWTSIPHPKEGKKSNCGSPFSKGYADLLSNGTISSADPDQASQLLENLKMISFWRSCRERVFSQRPYKVNGAYWVKTKTVVHGATTGRATEDTWLTTPACKTNKIGSELKAKIQSPKGYSFVSADFTSQELTIAAMFADLKAKIHGSCIISQICYAGDKSQKTDAHNVAARQLNQAYFDVTGHEAEQAITRTDSKPATFQTLYGAGVTGFTGYLQMLRPLWGEELCRKVAKGFMDRFKGKQVRNTMGKKIWSGGSASHAFNAMETFAKTGQARTPALKKAAPFPLQNQYCNDDFLPSRLNRTIQATGVDLLDIVQFMVAELSPELDYTSCFTYHDEVLYLVKNEDRVAFSKNLCIAHAYAWSILASNLGYNNLPAGYLFFSSLNWDTVFRKEPTGEDSNLETPSHIGWQDIPDGLDIKPLKLFAGEYDAI